MCVCVCVCVIQLGQQRRFNLCNVLINTPCQSVRSECVWQARQHQQRERDGLRLSAGSVVLLMSGGDALVSFKREREREREKGERE